MSSIKDRQRAAARARLEKEMAERAAAARKRRQTQTAVGAAVALVLVVAGTVWLVSSLGDKDTKKKDAPGAAAAAPGTANCTWNPEASQGQNKAIKNVGTPPTNVPATGNATLTINTNLGPITATVDRAKAPCTAASFAYLASKKFWDNTKCHRLVTEGLKVLQCGDPSATGKGYRPTDGQGGPSYRFDEENLPVGKQPGYPAGTIAMAKTQEPGTTGSQFFICYEDVQLPPQYTVLGMVTKGLDIVKNVAKAGTDNPKGGDGHPKTEVDIKTLTVAAA